MKTLIVSLALFLFADGDHVTKSNATATKETSKLNLEELMDLRNESPQSIDKKLTMMGWINTTEEDIKKKYLKKNDYNWESGEITKVSFTYYAPTTEINSTYEGANIRYYFRSEDGYNSLIKQAQATGGKKKLKKSKVAEHEENEGDGLHYYNKDYNIFFLKSTYFGTSYSVLIYGKKK